MNGPRIMRVEVDHARALEYAAYLRAHERRPVQIYPQAIRAAGTSCPVWVVVDVGVGSWDDKGPV